MFDRLFASNQRPYFKHRKKSRSWDTLNFDLSGNRFEITLPPHDDESPKEPHRPNVNVFDTSIYAYNSDPDYNGYPASKRGITAPGILKRAWSTYGPPWRFQCLGILSVSITVCDISKMAADLNCFNPEQFERLIMFYLYNNRGPGRGLSEHTCPINWKIHNIEGTEWVYLESWPRRPEWKEEDDNRNREANFTVWLLAPIFADKHLLLTFYSTGSRPPAPSNKLMLERIEAIISGLRLQLSPEALKQKTEAEQRSPGAKYSQHREPEAWKYYTSYRKGDILKGEKELVFEGPCSPPPPLY